MFTTGGSHDLWETDADTLALVRLIRVQSFLQDGDDLWQHSLPQLPNQVSQSPGCHLHHHKTHQHQVTSRHINTRSHQDTHQHQVTSRPISTPGHIKTHINTRSHQVTTPGHVRTLQTPGHVNTHKHQLMSRQTQTPGHVDLHTKISSCQDKHKHQVMARHILYTLT